MQEVIDFIFNNGIIIFLATFVVGEIIKTSIKVIPNDFIPLIGGVIGVLLGVFIPNIFPDADILTAAIYGLALGWSATGGYETLRNLPNIMKKGE